MGHLIYLEWAPQQFWWKLLVDKKTPRVRGFSDLPKIIVFEGVRKLSPITIRWLPSWFQVLYALSLKRVQCMNFYHEYEYHQHSLKNYFPCWLIHLQFASLAAPIIPFAVFGQHCLQTTWSMRRAAESWMRSYDRWERMRRSRKSHGNIFQGKKMWILPHEKQFSKVDKLRLDVHLLGKSMESMINSEEIWPMV